MRDECTLHVESYLMNGPRPCYSRISAHQDLNRGFNGIYCRLKSPLHFGDYLERDRESNGSTVLPKPGNWREMQEARERGERVCLISRNRSRFGKGVSRFSITSMIGKRRWKGLITAMKSRNTLNRFSCYSIWWNFGPSDRNQRVVNRLDRSNWCLKNVNICDDGDIVSFKRYCCQIHLDRNWCEG